MEHLGAVGQLGVPRLEKRSRRKRSMFIHPSTGASCSGQPQRRTPATGGWILAQGVETIKMRGTHLRVEGPRSELERAILITWGVA